jgi:hypothetical protein
MTLTAAMESGYRKHPPNLFNRMIVLLKGDLLEMNSVDRW